MCSEKAGCKQLCPRYTLIQVKKQRFSSDEQGIYKSLVMISRKQSWKKNKGMCMPSFLGIQISNGYNRYSV